MLLERQIGIIGLGKFGLSFGRRVCELGFPVIGVDRDQHKVNRAQDVLTQVYQTEVISREVLQQLGFHELTHVMVCIGDDVSNSALLGMYLLELGVPELWVKTATDDHRLLLTRLGVHHPFIPEDMAAEHLAYQLAVPGFIDHLPFDPEVMIQRLPVTALAGKSLREAALTNTYGVQIIALRGQAETTFRYVPRADDRFELGGELVLLGHRKNLVRIKS